MQIEVDSEDILDLIRNVCSFIENASYEEELEGMEWGIERLEELVDKYKKCKE